MNNKSDNKYYRTIQKYSFALLETNLYLDTHPDDNRALEYFDKVRRLHNSAVEAYEKKFGPLTANSSDTTVPWSWIKGPWPWEYEAN